MIGKKSFITIMALMLSSGLIFGQRTFTLSSKDIGGQATVTELFNGFGCTGKNQSPQLSWANAPEETKSFAITMYDPDAPTGSGWWHWVMFDIPSNIQELPSNSGNTNLNLAPKETIQSLTDFGVIGYGGPCPPKGHGIHQYIITIYALKVETLGLDKNASPALVGFNIGNHVLSKASIVFYYQR